MENSTTFKKDINYFKPSRLFCWGFGKYGQIGSLDYQYSAELIESINPIGQNSIMQMPSNQNTPIRVTEKENFSNINNYFSIKEISCGEFHTAILSHENNLYIYGKNTFGQLGQGHTDILFKPNLVKFPNKVIIEKIALGGEHTLALSNFNDLYSWGLNIFGQLGLNSTENRLTPTKVEKFRTIVKNEEGNNVLKEFLRKQNESEQILEIGAGAQHSLILTSKNYLYSCGFSQNGSLGYFSGKDDPHESTVFTRIHNKYSSTRKFSKIACGVNHSGCVLDSSEILIWGKGDNLFFEHIKRIPFSKESSGDMSNPGTSLSPSSMFTISDYQIGENFFVVRMESGEIYSCGTNEYGQLGLGFQYKYVKTPEKIILQEKIKFISVGYGYVYAISSSNLVYGWGNNKYGQLLENINEKIATPKEIISLNDLNCQMIKCGAYHVVATSFNLNLKLQNNLIKYDNLNQGQSQQITSPNKNQSIINTPSIMDNLNTLFQYKTFGLNKNFNPAIYEQEIQLLEFMEKKQKTLEDELLEKEKEIEKLTKSVEEKKQAEKKTQLLPGRNKRKSDLNVKVTNPLLLFDEEIRFEDLQFFNNSDVGVGTFGEVKRGYWRKTLVAIKFLKKTMENEEENIKSFIEELNLLKRLRHPNILLYIGACTSGPHYFLVTEYCENGNLFDFLHTQVKKNNLPFKDRVRIATEIAKGVNYLHSFNPPILHRDLKSLNILLDKNLTVKIADFGWARLRDIHMTKQRGTFQWMAPEVIKKSSYTEKADVFSFAIILWELWVQEPPYKNIDRIQVAKKVATDKNYRPHMNKEIPEEIKNLMVACWDYDPEARPNFETVVDYLENLEKEIAK